MATLERAIAIAAEAHAGQTDKAGSPYILHPLRVMMAMPDDLSYRIVAVLHDVLEDCPDWTADRLSREGFTVSEVNAVVTLTRRPLDTYGAYIERVCGSEIGCKVKLMDLYDNMDASRYRRQADINESLMLRYRRAYDTVSEALVNFHARQEVGAS